MRKLLHLVLAGVLALLVTACFEIAAQNKFMDIEKNSANNVVRLGPKNESNDLMYIIVTIPTHGALDGAVPDLTYTPDTDYVGKDSFTYKISDGDSESNVATISINIVDPNPSED